MVRFSVSPLFHALTVATTEQPRVGTGVVVTGSVVVTGGVVGVVVVANWEMNFHTSPDVQVRAPLVSVEPSTGSGVWSPSKAAHCTGKPDLQPEYTVVMCRRLPRLGSAGVCVVHPLFLTKVSRRERPFETSRTLSWVPWMPK